MVFVFRNCTKAFLSEANALGRLPQTVTRALSVTDCLDCCPSPEGSDHCLLTIPLTHEKPIGNHRMAQVLYCPHISK